ncbi:MAG: UPF0158 family protein [Flavitalea sp.]
MELWMDAVNKVEKNEDDYLEIEPMSSHEQFEAMEEFVESIQDKFMRGKLLQALGGKKPFANFKLQIDNSGPYREVWFAFKNEQSVKWVRKQLEDLG